MILVSTLGFDEKFALRSVLRNSLSPKDEIYLILPRGNEPRVAKAINNLREIVERGFSDVKVQTFEIPLESFSGAVSRVRNLMKNFHDQRIVINLSGGQRVVLLIVLAAILSLDIEAKIEIETEDSGLLFEFPIGMLKPTRLDELDGKILKIIADVSAVTMNELASRLMISKTSAWRRLERLKTSGLLCRNQRKAYSLTDLGRSRTT
jgi:CRISPR locus-related DNA-binding protein